jgi:hypothetical protein
LLDRRGLSAAMLYLRGQFVLASLAANFYGDGQAFMIVKAVGDRRPAYSCYGSEHFNGSIDVLSFEFLVLVL